MFENNRICKILKTKYPLIQGGMAWVSDASIAAAVSNAGGLGVIAASAAPLDVVEAQLIKVRQLTDKPFGLNIMLMSETVDGVMELAIKHKVPVVTCGAGKPARATETLKKHGIAVIPVVASIKHAKVAVAAGVDAVVAEGCESGGHVGHTSSFPLLPQIVDAVGSDVPVLGAGGVFDGRGMYAMFALGAEGVQMGTRFICAEETNVSDYYKQKIIEAYDDPTVVTGASIGPPVRAIKNHLIAKFQELEKANAPIAEIQALGTGKLRLAVETGDPEFGSFQCGEVCGAVRKIEPAADIIKDVIEGFIRTQKRMTEIEAL